MVPSSQMLMLFVGGHAVQKLVNPRTEMMPRKSNVTGEGRGRGKTALARCKQWAKHSVRPSLLEEGIIHQSHTRRTRRRTRRSEGVFSKATVHPECKFHRWAASLKALRPFYNPQNKQTHILPVWCHTGFFNTWCLWNSCSSIFFFAKTKRCCLQTITAFTTWLVSVRWRLRSRRLNKETKESQSIFTFDRTIKASMLKKDVCLWLSWKIVMLDSLEEVLKGKCT